MTWRGSHCVKSMLTGGCPGMLTWSPKSTAHPVSSTLIKLPLQTFIRLIGRYTKLRLADLAALRTSQPRMWNQNRVSQITVSSGCRTDRISSVVTWLILLGGLVVKCSLVE